MENITWNVVIFPSYLELHKGGKHGRPDREREGRDERVEGEMSQKPDLLCDCDGLSYH